MSDSSNEAPTVKPTCECYKKLHLYGVPLYISDENDEYSERHEFSYEGAFKLPGLLKVNTAISRYPAVEDTELSFVFQEMAEVLPGLSDFEVNVLSFWILDVFIEGLWTAQTAHMSHDHQRITLQWIAFFFNYVMKNNPMRHDMFTYLKTIFFLPEKSELGSEEMLGEFMKTETEDVPESSVESTGDWQLPLPPGVERKEKEDGTSQESVESQEDLTSNVTDARESGGSSSSGFNKPETVSERNMRHMKIILEILYRIFARLWVFTEIQSTFHGMPPVNEIELPFTLNFPKPKFKPEGSVASKTDRNGKRPGPPSKEVEDIEAEREIHKNDFILPLQESEEAKAYMKQSVESFSNRSATGRRKLGKK